MSWGYVSIVVSCEAPRVARLSIRPYFALPRRESDGDAYRRNVLKCERRAEGAIADGKFHDVDRRVREAEVRLHDIRLRPRETDSVSEIDPDNNLPVAGV